MAAPEMICRLMQARTAAHMNHLKTTSFAEHKALDGFYSGLVDLIDSFAETYQGIFGLIKEYPTCPIPTGDAIVWIGDLRAWLKSDRADSCKGERELENIHDEIMAHFSSTLYKMRFLDNPTTHEDDESPSVEAAEDFMKMSKWTKT